MLGATPGNTVLLQSARGGWVSVTLETAVSQIWMMPVQKGVTNDYQVGDALGDRWQVKVYDASRQRGHIQKDYCQSNACLPGSLLAPPGMTSPTPETIPAFCPGQAADGMNLVRYWENTQPGWWDFTHHHGFEAIVASSDQTSLWIFQVTAYSLEGTYSVLYQDAHGIDQRIGLDQAVLFGDRAKTIALDPNPSGLRFVSHSYVLYGMIPKTVDLQKAWLIKEFSGPVWRLSCDGPEQKTTNDPSPQPSGNQHRSNQPKDPIFELAFPGFNALPVQSQAFHLDPLNLQWKDWPVLLTEGQSAQVGEKMITLQASRTVPGSAEALTYTPSSGVKAVTSAGMTYDWMDWKQVFLPPGSTLLLVQITVDPESPPNCTDYQNYRFAVESRSFPTIQAWNFPHNDLLSPYPSANTDCLTGGWLYFFLPSLQVDTGALWVTVTSTLPDQSGFAIWQLRP